MTARSRIELGPHTLKHALYPVECGHFMEDITTCVYCRRALPAPRDHVDTCKGYCTLKLREAQGRLHDQELAEAAAYQRSIERPVPR